MSPEMALVLAAGLLAGNAFFVAAEFALVSARRSAIELRVLNGSRAAQITVSALENISVLLATVQLGVTVCSLGLGALGEPALAHLLSGPLSLLGLPEIAVHAIAFSIALGLIMFLHVLLGEMVPKNLALTAPERMALWLVPPLTLLVQFLGPVVRFLSSWALWTLRLFGVKPRTELSSTYSRDEVADLVEESHREGLLTSDEEHLLHDALQFDVRTIKPVFIPLKEVVGVDRQATPAGIEKLASNTGYSRFPIVEKGIVDGYIHIKDVLENDPAKRQQPVPADKVRQIAEVSLRNPLRQVLKQMQHSRSHLAVVRDTKGKAVGIVTLEDVLEELVGEMKTQGPSR